jgi:HEAT repeat protein
MGLREWCEALLDRSETADDLDWLIDALSSTDHTSSGPAARKLALLETPGVEERLFSIIRILDLEAGDWTDHYLVMDREMLASIIKALGRRGSKAVPALIGALDDRHQEVRKAAAEALGEIGDPQAIEPLLQAMIREKEGPNPYKWAVLRFQTAAVDHLLPLLSHEDTTIRVQAAQMLAELGDERALEPLIAALNTPDTPLRFHLVISLGKLGDRRAVEPLLTLLTDETPSVRHHALLALGALGDKRIVPVLLDALQRDASLLHGTVIALGELGDPRGVEVALAALSDANESIRFGAARSLGAMGDPQAAAPLIAALADPSQSVREAAVRSLAALGDHQAIPPLIDALKQNSLLASEAAAALGVLGGPRAVDALLGAVSDPQLWGWGAWGPACRALRALGVPAPAVLFTTLNEAPSYKRRQSITALGLIGDLRALEPLIAILTNSEEDEQVREAAATALATLKDERALPPLIAILEEDEEEDMRCSAALALGQMGHAQALAPLLAALKDEEPAVRIAASTALGVLGDPEALPALRLVEREDDGQRWDGVMVDGAAIEAIATIQHNTKHARNA